MENQEKNQEEDDDEDKEEPAPGSPQAQQWKLHMLNTPSPQHK